MSILNEKKSRVVETIVCEVGGRRKHYPEKYVLYRLIKEHKNTKSIPVKIAIKEDINCIFVYVNNSTDISENWFLCGHVVNYITDNPITILEDVLTIVKSHKIEGKLPKIEANLIIENFQLGPFMLELNIYDEEELESESELINSLKMPDEIPDFYYCKKDESPKLLDE